MVEGSRVSKDEAARVRDELVKELYRAVLLCDLHAAGTGKPAGSHALAAGVCANLQLSDLLLLPARRGTAFRVLRRAPGRHAAADFEAGVLALPRESAMSFALGAAAALKRSNAGALAVVLLPASAASPSPWDEAGIQAAQLGLPLLLVSEEKTAPRAGTPEKPAPSYPTIPVDGDDALAVYRVAYECAARARAGLGPSRIAGVPFHVRRQAPAPGALARLEAMLRARGAWDKAWRRRQERTLIAELSQ